MGVKVGSVFVALVALLQMTAASVAEKASQINVRHNHNGRIQHFFSARLVAQILTGNRR